MAEKSMSLDELVRKLLDDEHADVLRETLAWFVGDLMEAEVAGQIGAGLTRCARCACGSRAGRDGGAGGRCAAPPSAACGA